MKFNPNQDYILEDDRVLLRPLRYDDLKYLLPFALYEHDLWKYSLVSAAGEEGMSKYINDALSAKSIGKEYPFIVFDKQTNTYAGCTRFYDIQPIHLTLQLGYTWYGSKFQGTGLNKHCKFLLLQFAFETIGIQRVEFRANNNNERSIAAMKSLGCRVEGVLRSTGIEVDGNRRDSIVLSILKEEWEHSIKEQLKTKLI